MVREIKGEIIFQAREKAFGTILEKTQEHRKINELKEQLQYIQKVGQLVYKGRLKWLTSSSPNYSGPKGGLEYVLNWELGNPNKPKLNIYPVKGDFIIHNNSSVITTPYKTVSSNQESVLFDFEGIAVRVFYLPRNHK